MRQVPKLLTDDIKERVKMSEKFSAMVCHHSMAMLDNIVTMDESAKAFHTPEIKQHSRQWLPKGQPRSMQPGLRKWSWPSSIRA
jgi:hypothetical protein